MKQPNDDLSNAMELLSVRSDVSETSKPPKNLSDMPVVVIRKITGRSDYKQQLILRKTSKTLRNLVDKHQPALTRLKVTCGYDYVTCYYNDHRVGYFLPSWYHAVFLENYRHDDCDPIVSSYNYEQDALNDLASIFKNPKLQFETFSFNIEDSGAVTNGMDFEHYMDRKYRSDSEKMQKTLKSLNHKLSVRACSIEITSHISYVMSILPFLKPGILEKISLRMHHPYFNRWDEYSEEIEQLSLLEQWTQAKELHLDHGHIDTFPTGYATHFKRFQFDYIDLEAGTMIWIRDYILKHENVEFCLVTDNYLDIEELDGTMGTIVSSDTSVYTSPDSKYYLEFKIDDYRITIEKKKKK